MKLYQVTTKYFVAGYVEDDKGNLIQCAPILLKKFSYWKTKSKLIGEYYMAKQYKITKIEYNQKMANKYAGAFLHTVGVETDKPRKDFVFENSKQFKVLQECAVGNIVELKIVKNGDFFNLAKEDDAIILVSKEVVEPETKAEAPPAYKATESPVKEYTKYKEDPDKQAAIIRQNALTNATNLMIARMGGLGAVDAIVKDIIEIAIQFAKYTSGEDMTEYLMEDVMLADCGKPAGEIKRGRKPKDVVDISVTGSGLIERGEFGE